MKVDGKVPELVWHYTSAEGLLGIIRSGSLWASAPSSLNDVSEFRYGVDVLEAAWREIRPATLGPEHEKFDESLHGLFDATDLIYVLSTSVEQDSLGQWRGYAGKQGFALALDTSVELEDVQSPPKPETEFVANWLPESGWYEVIYDRDEQDEIARAALDSAAQLPTSLGRLIRWTAIQQIFAQAAVRMKHRGFHEEHEMRYVYSSRQDYRPPSEFRPGPFGITPYVSLHAPDSPSSPVPLREIQCGPTGNAAADATSRRNVERLLEGRYSGIPVSSSEIPFRP